MSKVSRLSGLVSEYFIVESLLGSTRTADVYKALDKFKRQSVALLRTRVPLSVRLKHVDYFVDRVAQISRYSPSTEILSFGIDAGGYGFVVFPSADGVVLGSSAAEMPELERRFLGVLRIIDKFHSAGIACEDFTIESFIVDRTGAIRLLGIVAGLDTDGEGTTDLPPVHTLRYLAPEHRAHGGGSIRGDVYALGVLGFKLFAGVFPDLGEDETYDGSRRPSDFNASVPGWVNSIISGCFVSDPCQRYDSAGAILHAINAWRESEALRGLTPVVPGSDRSSKNKFASSAVVPIELGHRMGEQKTIEAPEEPKVEKKRIGPVGGLAIAGIIGVFGWTGYQQLVAPDVDVPKLDVNVTPGDIEVVTTDGEQSSKAQFVTRLVSSDDPVAHDHLIRELKEAQSKEFVDFVWRAILDRARRLGIIRASDQLRAWGKSQGVNFSPVTMEPLLRTIDSAYPQSERIAVLSNFYPTYPKLIIRFTAALALDLGAPDDFRDVIATMAKDSDKLADAQDHSALAVMLLLPEVNTIFLDDIVSMANRIPDSDLSWLMSELAKRGSPQVMKVADLALSRKLVKPPFTAFLEVLRRKSVIPQPVMVALVSGAFDKLGEADGVTLSQWFDQDSFAALAATIFTTNSRSIKQAAFEAMAIKPAPNRLIGRVIEFAKVNYKENASAVADIAAALALEERLGNIDLDLKLKEIEVLPKSKDLLMLLLTSESPRVIKAIVENYDKVLTSTAYLDILSHKEKSVRLLAVEHLHSANDVVALKILIDSYESETDGDVRAAYERHISVVRERIQR